MIQKRTKRKELADVDIAPMIRKADMTADDHNVFIDLTVQAQNPGLNPQLIEKAIVAYLPALTPDSGCERAGFSMIFPQKGK